MSATRHRNNSVGQSDVNLLGTGEVKEPESPIDLLMSHGYRSLERCRYLARKASEAILVDGHMLHRRMSPLLEGMVARRSGLRTVIVACRTHFYISV
jgi:hypothetical protein